LIKPLTGVFDDILMRYRGGFRVKLIDTKAPLICQIYAYYIYIFRSCPCGSDHLICGKPACRPRGFRFN
jgi:hypothetical protein